VQITRQVRQAFVSAALSFAASLPTLAMPPMMGGPERGGPMMSGSPMGMPGMPPFLHGLKLSEAQEDKVFDIQYGQIPLLREQEKSLHKAQEELHKLALSGQYDDAKAKVLTDRIAHAIVGIELLHAQADSRLFQVLTDEQRKELAEHMNEHEGGPDHPHR